MPRSVPWQWASPSCLGRGQDCSRPARSPPSWGEGPARWGRFFVPGERRIGAPRRLHADRADDRGRADRDRHRRRQPRPARSRRGQAGERGGAAGRSARVGTRRGARFGLSARWEPLAEQADGSGFRFVGLPANESLPTHWLDANTAATVIGARAIVLGPEPLIGEQRIVLRLDNQRLVLATDGIGPFVVADSAVPPP